MTDEKYIVDLTCFNFELDNMWNIIGINQKRVDEIVSELDKILEIHRQMQFKDFMKEALQTIPQNKKEFNWLLFHMGMRFQVVNTVHEHFEGQATIVKPEKEKIIN